MSNPTALTPTTWNVYLPGGNGFEYGFGDWHEWLNMIRRFVASITALRPLR